MRVFVFALALLVGCHFSLGRRITPDLMGCYQVRGNWTPAHAQVTGFASLPGVIAFDTAPDNYFGRTLAPEKWRQVNRLEPNTVGLSLASYNWSVEGDALTRDRGPWHDLPTDSAIVTFRGWTGELVAYLRRDGNVFSGRGFLFSRNGYLRDVPANVPSLPIELRSGPCGSDLTADLQTFPP